MYVCAHPLAGEGCASQEPVADAMSLAWLGSQDSMVGAGSLHEPLQLHSPVKVVWLLSKNRLIILWKEDA